MRQLLPNHLQRWRFFASTNPSLIAFDAGALANIGQGGRSTDGWRVRKSPDRLAANLPDGVLSWSFLEPLRDGTLKFMQENVRRAAELLP